MGPGLYLGDGALDCGTQLAEVAVEFFLPVQQVLAGFPLERHDSYPVDTDVAEVCHRVIGA